MAFLLIYKYKEIKISSFRGLNRIKIKLFKIINKVMEVIYKLDLLLKIKIYLVYYIAMLKLVHGNYKLLVYK